MVAQARRFAAAESPAIRRVRTAAQNLCVAVERRMEDLIDLVEEEADLVRHHKAAALKALEPRKKQAAREFIAALEAVKKIRPALESHTPDVMQRLRFKHGEFRAMLQVSLASLAAAKAASDDIDGANEIAHFETEPRHAAGF